MRVVVTGGTGKGGAWVVRELRAHGHDVLNVDTRHDGSAFGLCLVADLTDLGQAQEALAGADAVVHFAAIPAPRLRPEGETFRNNALSTYNVFAAAVGHGLRRVVWASSETVLGLPFDIPPAFAPIDESIEPRPETSYALSKLVGETMAAQFARRSAIGFVGLRISNIMEPDDYALFPSYWADPQPAQMEPVGIRRCARRRDRGPARAGGPDRGLRGRDHRGRRHGHDAPERGPDGRGVSFGPAAPAGRGTRDPARDRTCPPVARLPAGPQLGRSRPAAGARRRLLRPPRPGLSRGVGVSAVRPPQRPPSRRAFRG